MLNWKTKKEIREQKKGKEKIRVRYYAECPSDRSWRLQLQQARFKRKFAMQVDFFHQSDLITADR